MKDIYGFLSGIWKSWNYLKTDARVHTTSILNDNSIRATFFRLKLNNTSRNNWKPLFEVNCSKNSTKTIRLFALDFYEAIVDSAFGLINYHLIEISSS